jgi:hypothetical protein
MRKAPSLLRQARLLFLAQCLEAAHKAPSQGELLREKYLGRLATGFSFAWSLQYS